MKISIYILLFSFLIGPLTYGENHTKLDSLHLIIRASNVDSIINQGFTEIGHILLSLENDSAMQIWTDLKESYSDKDYYNGLGRCSYVMARELRERGDYFTAYDYYNASLSYYRKDKSKLGMAVAHNGLGSLLKDLGQYNESEFHYLESAGLYKLLNDTIWEASIYLNLGGM